MADKTGQLVPCGGLGQKGRTNTIKLQKTMTAMWNSARMWSGKSTRGLLDAFLAQSFQGFAYFYIEDVI
jgi:hypothetical protein